MRSFPDIEIRAIAAQYRTATETCTCWRRELEVFNKARLDYGPAINQSRMGGGTFIDNCWWHSEAFADVLHGAAITNISVTEAKGKSTQAEAYRALMAATRPSDLAKLISPRIRNHCEKANMQVKEDELLEEIKETMGVAKQMSRQAAWALLRTWCNGWVTASRVGGMSKPCVFGCDHTAIVRDSLQHYIVCCGLWDTIYDELESLLDQSSTCASGAR